MSDTHWTLLTTVLLWSQIDGQQRTMILREILTHDSTPSTSYPGLSLSRMECSVFCAPVSCIGIFHDGRECRHKSREGTLPSGNKSSWEYWTIICRNGEEQVTGALQLHTPEGHKARKIVVHFHTVDYSSMYMLDLQSVKWSQMKFARGLKSRIRTLVYDRLTERLYWAMKGKIVWAKIEPETKPAFYYQLDEKNGASHSIESVGIDEELRLMFFVAFLRQKQMTLWSMNISSDDKQPLKLHTFNSRIAYEEGRLIVIPTHRMVYVDFFWKQRLSGCDYTGKICTHYDVGREIRHLSPWIKDNTVIFSDTTTISTFDLNKKQWETIYRHNMGIYNLFAVEEGLIIIDASMRGYLYQKDKPLTPIFKINWTYPHYILLI